MIRGLLPIFVTEAWFHVKREICLLVLGIMERDLITIEGKPRFPLRPHPLTTLFKEGSKGVSFAEYLGSL
jgi:hypothetical protein